MMHRWNSGTSRAVAGRANRLIIGAAALMVGVAASFVYPSAASASSCWSTLPCDTGYFSGQGAVNGTWPSDYLDVIDGGVPASVTNLQTFLQFMQNNLKCTSIDQPNSALGVPQNDDKGVGAAFYVVTMLGAPVKTPKNQACVRWTQWKNLVTQYDQAGLIKYNFNVATEPSSGLNSYYTHSFGGDIGFGHSSGNGMSIVFFKPGGNGIAYTIRRYCGNVTGVDTATITALPSNPPGGGGGGTTPPPGTPPPGTPPPTTPPPGTPPPATPPGQPPYGDINKPE